MTTVWYNLSCYGFIVLRYMAYFIIKILEIDIKVKLKQLL